jgi:Erv1 / Alr family
MSSYGIKTNFWGPHAWAFLFSSIAGSYPVRVDSRNKDHAKIVKGFQQMFSSLQYTLPCIFCRQSYSKFIKELPISKYSGSRTDMMKWLYLLHDKVNKKLIAQEKQCYETEKAALKAKNLTKLQLQSKLRALKSEVLITKPSPPFSKVLAMYEKHRAGCSKKARKCS